MKILVFSDLHLTNRNKRFRKRGKVSSLLEAQANFVKQIAKAATEDTDVACVVFCGDYVDYISIDPVTLSFLSSTLRDLDRIGKPVYMIVGNHGIQDKNNFHSILGGMRDLLTNVQIISEYTNIELPDSSGPHTATVNLHLIPYMTDSAVMIECFENANYLAEAEDNMDLAFGHTATQNSLLDNGLPSKTGIELTESMTSNMELTVLGDFHKFQEIPGVERSYYAGAPFDLKFGESDPNRGYLVIDVFGELGLELDRITNEFLIPLLDVHSSSGELPVSGDGAVRIVEATESVKRDVKALCPDGIFHFAMKKEPVSVSEDVEDVLKKTELGLEEFIIEEIEEASVDSDSVLQILRTLESEV